MRALSALAFAVVGLAAAAPYRPSFDHQTATYVVKHDPVEVSGSVTVELFFSPDHSIDTITKLITEAPQGARIDVGTPGFDSWSGCTYPEHGCAGCTVDALRDEKFPVFPALLNAVHKSGATVRLLTNNYNTPTCPDMISDLDWLALQDGIEVRYFASTTFAHDKYLHVHDASSAVSEDWGRRNATSTSSRKASVSSVNFSQTSFTENREAGVIVVGGTANGDKLLDALDAVFEDDWAASTPYVVNNTYSSSEMAIITSKDALEVSIPAPPSIPGEHVTPAPSPLTTSPASTTGIYVSPDHAKETLTGLLNSTKETLEIHMYQITDDEICYKVEDLFMAGVNVTLLASSDIYSSYDKNGARYCYKRLYDAGMKIRLSPSFFTYSHQKYIIVDGKTLSLSTGNLSPTDFNWPISSDGNYPPYSSPNWQDTNRDIQFWTTDASIIAAFREVLYGDFAEGSDYTPNWGEE